jgi:N-acyl-D-amino-acid deacylase
VKRWTRPLAAGAAVAVALLAATVVTPAPQEQFDVIISGGSVIDGTGNPWYIADVGVRGDTIATIGDLSNARATTRIDAAGRVVVPGFIDLHSHADEGRISLANPDAAAALNLVTQGITTVVVGQDGRCQCPVGERAALYRSQGIGPNVVQLVGHGDVRARVMDDAQREATPAELEQMVELVRQAMREGAAGLSSGLEYNPGRFSVTDEVIALARAAAESGGFYISHERSEGRTPMWWWPSTGGRPPDLIDAVQETIRVGEATGMAVVASHIKVKGADYWGTAPTVTRLIQEARDRGVQAYADQYPYTTTGTDGNTVLIPSWALDDEDGPPPGAGGRSERDFSARREAFRQRLDDPDAARRIRDDIAWEITRRGGADKLLILESHNPEFVGLTLADIVEMQQMSAIDVAIMLQLEGLDRPGGARMRGFSLDERDVEHYMAQEFTATCTDAGIAMDGSGSPHPRFYGTYPRKLRRYVLDGGVLSMAQAIRSSTSLPAQIAGLARRGLLREGFAADIAVIDTDDVADHATAMDPHRYSTGIDEVLINGAFAVHDGVPTGALAGAVLDGDELLHRRPAPPLIGALEPVAAARVAARR